MELYLLERIGPVAYDEYRKKVIIAKNNPHARTLANIRTGDEGKIWTDPKKVSCTRIDLLFPTIVLEDFKAG